MHSLSPLRGPRRFAAGFVALFVLLSAPALAVTIENPTVTGPIPSGAAPGDPSHDYPFLATQFNLKKFGYVEEEYFIEGTANRYDTPAGATGSVISSGHPFKTRIIVRRPAHRARFNGVVILEWQNVTAGYELDAHWFSSFEHILREGYVWVGVSAQRVGIHSAPTFAVQQALRQWSPVRYGSLDVTDGGTVLDDSLSYDVYSAAAQAIRDPEGVDPLGNLPTPKLIIAAGASQSAGRLTVYHNSVYPLLDNPPVDAFYLLVGGGPLRTDLDVTVFQLLSETDVFFGVFLGRPRQEDSDHFRRWEAAGTSHVSVRLQEGIEPLYARDGIIPSEAECDLPPRSRIPFHHVHNVAYDHLVRWVRHDIAPPTAPAIEFVSTFPPVIARDEHGNALGGIQLSQHAVPTATNTGRNSGGGFCILFGAHLPFDEATLDALYPTHGGYVARVVHKAVENLRDGYIVAADAFATIVDAARSDVGK